MSERRKPITRRTLLRCAAALGLPAILPPEAAAAAPFVQNPRVMAAILLNQVGYLPSDRKNAIVAASGPLTTDTFTVVDDAVAPRVRLHGPLTPHAWPNASAGTPLVYYTADFSALNEPGRYRLRLADGRLSEPFSVGGDIYRQLIPVVLQYFDTQICGAGSQAHGPCHEDDGVIVGGPRDGQRMDASGGWHDAGDYLKFVETTSFVTGVLATTIDRFWPVPRRDRSARQTRQALLATLRVGLDWLLKMHPSPDEFYYQVGGANDHDTWRLPETDSPASNKDWKPRPVLWGVGANLAGRVAASFAIAARLYHASDRAFAARCRGAAESAYALGLRNQKVVTTLPADFYPEQSWKDDMEWAAAELYRTTRRGAYRDQALAFSIEVGAAGEGPSVYSVHALAHLSLYDLAPARVDKDRLLGYLRADAEIVKKRAQNSPYAFGTPLTWGTAEAVAGGGILCHLYGRLAGDAVFTELARRQRDFLVGGNPWGISFVIGAGARYPLNPHHQIANLRGVELTGAMVGGPTGAETFKRQDFALGAGEAAAAPFLGPPLEPDIPSQAAVYHDVVQDYVTNEPANDYTIKFLLLAALDAFRASDT